MGGAATAAPIEAIGATAFNPATLSALSNQLSVGAEVVTPLSDISSSLPPGLGGAAGTTSGNSGWASVPAFALSWRPTPESPITYGFGLFGVAGYSVNYPASTTNPILTSHLPPGGLFGNLYADVSILQIAPSASLQVNDNLSVALSYIDGELCDT